VSSWSRVAPQRSRRPRTTTESILQLLGRFIDQRQQLSPNKGPTYAPAKLAQHEEASGITSTEFAKSAKPKVEYHIGQSFRGIEVWVRELVARIFLYHLNFPISD
jgi:hypothetical protein